MQNLRQPRKLDKGDRQISVRSVVFPPEGIYIYIERAKTVVEKVRLKLKSAKDFYLMNVSFTFFDVSEQFSYYYTDFFGLAKYDIPLLWSIHRQLSSRYSSKQIPASCISTAASLPTKR